MKEQKKSYNPEETRSFKNQLIAGYNKVGIFVILLVLIVICSILSPVFLTRANITNLLMQTAVVTMLSCGILMLIIAGHTDLSAGSMVALTGCVSVGSYKMLTTEMGVSPGMGIVAALLVSMAVGVIMYTLGALLISFFRAPAFIITLAISSVARGLVFLYTNGRVISNIGDVSIVGQGKLFDIFPYPVIAMFIIAIITTFLLKFTKMGRYLYAIGGNAEAAQAAGINYTATILKAFAIHGAFVGVAGLCFMARLNSGQPAEGVNLEFDAITACIIGGASLAGGIGSIGGTIVGSMIIGIISNILTLMAVQSYYQQICTGLIIAGAVVLDIVTKGKKY